MVWGRPLIVSAIAPYRFKFSQPWLTKRAITASHGHGGWAYRAIRSLTMSRFWGFTVGDSSGELYVASFRASAQCLLAWFPLHKLFHKYMDVKCSSRTNGRENNFKLSHRVSPSSFARRRLFAVDLVLSRDFFVPYINERYTRRFTAERNVTNVKTFWVKRSYVNSVAKLRNWSRFAYTWLCYYSPSVKLDWSLTDFSLDFLVLFLKARTKESAKSWVGLIDVLRKSFLQVGTRKYTKVETLTRAISCNEIETKTLSLQRYF